MRRRAQGLGQGLDLHGVERELLAPRVGLRVAQAAAVAAAELVENGLEKAVRLATAAAVVVAATAVVVVVVVAAVIAAVAVNEPEDAVAEGQATHLEGVEHGRAVLGALAARGPRSLRVDDGGEKMRRRRRRRRRRRWWWWW